MVRAVLDCCVRRTEPVTDHGKTLPGWWTQCGPFGRPGPPFVRRAGQQRDGARDRRRVRASRPRRPQRHRHGHQAALRTILAWLDRWQEQTGRPPGLAPAGSPAASWAPVTLPRPLPGDRPGATALPASPVPNNVWAKVAALRPAITLVQPQQSSFASESLGRYRTEVGSDVALRRAGRACTSFALKCRRLEGKAVAPGTAGPAGTVASTEGPATYGRGTRRPRGRPPHQDPGPRIAVRPPRYLDQTYFCRRTVS